MHRGNIGGAGINRGAIGMNRGGVNRANIAGANRGNLNRNATRNANINRNVNRNVNRTVNRNGTRNVTRSTVGAGVGGWARPARYWWRPGAAVAAGAAIGFVTAATAVSWAGAAPAANMCWYYTDQSKTQGFWDACPQ